MKRGYIGLDVGTSGCKAALVSQNGEILMMARREYGLECTGKGIVELDPNKVWKSVVETLQELSKAEADIKEIAVSSIGEAMVMLDEKDRILRNGITYLDSRGEETISKIREKMDDIELLKLTGIPMNFIWSLNRYIWLCENEPDVVERTKKYFLFGDYITYKLSGERVIDSGSASKTMMLNVETEKWDKKICDKFEVPFENFSQVKKVGTKIGKIRKEVAELTGLPYELEVVVGCHDQCSATLGSGAISRGSIAAGEGSTESINLVVSKEDITEEFLKQKICFEPYIIPGTYQVPVGQLSHGTSIRWFVNEFGWDFNRKGSAFSAIKTEEKIMKNANDKKSIYDLANLNCAENSGDVYFLPYLTRSNLMDVDNKSLGTFVGLDVNTGRSKMYRALLEGLCFESRKCFDILRASGLYIKGITATGGCSNSALFMQMKSDILQCPIQILSNKDSGIMGLAMICAVSSGDYKNYEEAAEVFVKISGGFFPQKDYSKKYEKYCLIHRIAKEMYRYL